MNKLIANLLLVFGLVAGSFAAASAYLVPVTLDDDRFRLNAPAEDSDAWARLSQPAGALVSTRTGERKPYVPAGTALTPEVLSALREIDPARTQDGFTVELPSRIHVREFAWSRWQERWIFLLAVLALLTAGILLRAGARRASGNADTHADADDSPIAHLTSIADQVRRLRAGTDSLPDDQAAEAVVETIGNLQRNELVEFTEPAVRARLIASMGLARFAQMMDRFAAAERQLNRAWSAAADGYISESLDSLANAQPMLDEVLAFFKPR